MPSGMMLTTARSNHHRVDSCPPLECTDDFKCYVQYGTDDVESESASLWFAGKQMLQENKLGMHVGRHEKTKAVVKLQKKGQGAPSREPVCTPALLPAV
jgi:hypothetical protein